MHQMRKLQKPKASDSETQSLIEIQEPMMNSKVMNRHHSPKMTTTQSRNSSQSGSYSWLTANGDSADGSSPSASTAGSQTSTVKTDGPDGKYPLFSVFGITMLTLGTLIYSSLGTVAKLSYEGRKEPSYHRPSVLILSELTKLVASVLLLWHELRFDASSLFRSVFGQSWKNWVVFSVPAALYSVTNLLDFFLVQYMDPGSMQVLQQSKTLTTAVLWWIWFRKRISRQQWVALLILSAGCACAVAPSGGGSDNEKQGSYVRLPEGPLLIALQTLLSALAGVYTEAVYKRGGGQHESIHLANIGMYLWGVVSAVGQWFIHERTPQDSLTNLTRGFNVWTWLMVALFASMGLIIAQVMKFFSNIIKLFMLGASVICAGLLSYLVVGVPWTKFFVIGMVLVVFSIYLYKTERVWIR